MSVHFVVPLRFVKPRCSSIRHFSTHFPRSAKPTKAKPVSIPARKTGSNKLPAGRSSVPITNAVPRQTTVGHTGPQQTRAVQLYNAGVRDVYREGSKSRIIASWLIGGGCILSAGLVVSLRFWDTDNLVGMGKWQRTFVAGANRVVPIFLSLVGGGVILRYTGSIRSIRLVAVSPSRVNLQVRVRRRVPWSNTNYVVEPADLLMPRNWRRELVPEVESGASQKLGNTLGSPYRWMRAWINNERIISPVWLDKNSVGYLDCDGKFGIPTEDFAAITSEGSRRS